MCCRTSALVAAALVAALVPPASAAPTDPFFAALPAHDTQAPDALAVADSDGSVDASTGTSAYKLPIVVPPGRGDMAPELALAYSSQRPLRGGVAVGWELDVGSIEKDPEVAAGTAYRVDWNGISERLIPVTGDPWTNFTQTFRAERDASFTRFVYFTPTAGNTYGEQELTAVEYTSNPAANLAAHARIEIVRSPLAWCGAPIGASLDHHIGVLRAKGSRAIDTIDVKVKSAPGAAWQLRRRHRLDYDQQQLSCGSGSALRYLSRFEVAAYDPAGAATVVPPVTFTYGAPTRALTRTISAPSFGGGERGTWEGPTSMLLDIDDDGWPDRLTITETTRCNLVVQRGTGVGTFAATTTSMPLPSARWKNSANPNNLEGCTLSGQTVDRGAIGAGQFCKTHSAQVTYSFLDWDGDGLVDIVTNLHESFPGAAGLDFPASTSGPSSSDPPPCPPAQRVPEPSWSGFLVRVQRDLGGLAFVPFASAMQVDSPVPLPQGPSPLSTGEVVRPGVPALVDITGDGLVDAISLIPNPVSPPIDPPMPGTQNKLYVWPSIDGTRFGTRQEWTMPQWDQELQATAWNETQGWLLSPGTVNVTDLDGDGLADLVVELGNDTLAVVRNTGNPTTGFRATSLLTLAGPSTRRAPSTRLGPSLGRSRTAHARSCVSSSTSTPTVSPSTS